MTISTVSLSLRVTHSVTIHFHSFLESPVAARSPSPWYVNLVLVTFVWWKTTGTAFLVYCCDTKVSGDTPNNHAGGDDDDFVVNVVDVDESFEEVENQANPHLCNFKVGEKMDLSMHFNTIS